jgi:ankyrin repeat protein
MKRIHLLPGALLLAAVSAASAQNNRADNRDTRAKVSLKLPSHEPLVADAAMKGDFSAVKKAIASGADVDIAQGDGMTALHWAADRGDTATVAALLKAKADIKAVTVNGGYTPLMLAARAGNAAIVKQLLAAGADPKAVSGAGGTALHFAAEAGSAEAVNALVAKGADVNAREPEWGQTPLIFAAEQDRAAAIAALLKAGANPNIHTKVVNVSEQTAREQAAAKKRNEVLISFEPKARRDSADAAFKKQQEAASSRFQGQRGTGPNGTFTAQDSALLTGRAGGGAGANVLGRNATRQPAGPFTSAQIQAAIDSGRAVYLSSAAAKGPVREEVDTLNGGVAGFLNSVGGVGGLSALHHAVRQGSVDAVKALLAAGADVNDATDTDGTTPLLSATINGQFDVALVLIEAGADVNKGAKTGFTPLYATINTQWAPKSRYPQPQALQNQKSSYLDVMEALLKKGADPNYRIPAQPFYFAYNNCGNANCGLEQIEGTTPFWRAAYSVDVEAMKLLVAYHADPNIPSKPPARGGRRGGGAGGPTPPPVVGDSTARAATQVAQAGGAGRGGRGGGAGRGGAGAAAGAPAAGAPAAGAPAAGAAAARGGGGGGGGGFGEPSMPNLPEIDSLARIAPVGPGVLPIHAVAGVGYGNGYAGNSHRHAPDGWLPALKYMVEVLHADVNARDNNGMTPLHHAAARGDNDMILYLVAHGADVKAVSRRGQTVVDMANAPVSRLRPFPETIALLEKLGSVNQHHCVGC